MLLLGSVQSMSRSLDFPEHKALAHRAMPRRTSDIIVPVFKLFNSNVLQKGATRMADPCPGLGKRHLPRMPRQRLGCAPMLALTLKNQSVGTANCAIPSCSRNRNRAYKPDMKRVGHAVGHACSRRTRKE